MDESRVSGGMHMHTVEVIWILSKYMMYRGGMIPLCILHMCRSTCVGRTDSMHTTTVCIRVIYILSG